jgi:hypothetical protein
MGGDLRGHPLGVLGLGIHVSRCGSEQRSRYFPSFASDLILALSMRSGPPGVMRRYRCRPGLVEIFPRSSPRFITGSVSDPAINSSSWPTNCSRMCVSRVAPSGLWQITNRSVSDTFTSLTRTFSAISV